MVFLMSIIDTAGFGINPVLTCSNSFSKLLIPGIVKLEE